MKRIFAFVSALVICTLMILSPAFTACAYGGRITISEDLKTLNILDETFTRFNSSSLQVEFTENEMISVTLSDAQKETIEKVELDYNIHANIYRATVYYKDGSDFTATYLRDSHFEVFNKIISGEIEEYIVDFEYPEGNTISAKKEHLLGEKVSLGSGDFEYADYYWVTAQNDTGSICAIKGFMLVIGEKFFYVDCEENNIKDRENFFLWSYDSLSAMQIENEELLEALRAAEDEYYNSDFGFLLDEDLNEIVAAVIIIFIFAVLPLVAFVIFLIAALRSKTIYKKFFVTICVLAAAELVIFAMIALLILL